MLFLIFNNIPYTANRGIIITVHPLLIVLTIINDKFFSAFDEDAYINKLNRKSV